MAESNPSTSSKLTVYPEADFGGTFFEFVSGDYDVNALMQNIGNNTISSIKVPDGYEVALFDGNTFDGAKEVFAAGNVANIGAMNNRVSSLQLRPADTSQLRPPKLIVYTDTDYWGRRAEYEPGDYDVNELMKNIGNNTITSVKVPDGYEIALFDGNTFDGAKEVFTAGNVANIGAMNNRVSSLQLRPADTPQLRPSRVTVYTDTDYWGRRAELDPGDHDVNALATAIGNNVVTSIKVPDGYETALFDGNTFDGAYGVFKAGNFNNISSMNNRTSSIQIRGGSGNFMAFTEKDFWGRRAEFDIGDHDVNTLMQTIGNNTITSIKVPAGLEAALFDGNTFDGAKYVFSAGDHIDVGAAHNRASSLQVRPVDTPQLRPTKVIVYTDTDYWGRRAELEPGDHDVNALMKHIGNNTITSIKVPDGYEVALFDGNTFDGAKEVLKAGNIPKLITLDNRVSSLQIRSADTPQLRPTKVIVYTDTDYWGRRAELEPGDHDVNALMKHIGNNTITSIKVPDGYEVALFDGNTFDGAKAVFAAGNIVNIGTLNNRVSSLQIRPANTAEVSSSKVVVYTDTDYWGRRAEFVPGDHDVNALMASAGNNTITSIKVPEGYEVTLFDGNTFDGAQEIAKAGNTSKLNILDNRVSSIRVSVLSSM